MNRFLYSVLTISLLLLIEVTPTTASPTPHGLSDTPADVQRKAAAREKKMAAREKVVAAKASRQVSRLKRMALKSRKVTSKIRHAVLVMFDLEDSKAITSPARLRRQLHSHQKQLKFQVRKAARARRHRAH